MDINDFIEQQKLLKTFHTKAKKCANKADMIVFCESFLNKYQDELPKKDRIDLPSGTNLGSVRVPSMYGTDRVYEIELLSLSTKTTVEALEHFSTTRRIAPKKLYVEEIAKPELTTQLSKGLIENGYVHFYSEMNNFSFEYETTAQLVVGKKV